MSNKDRAHELQITRSASGAVKIEGELSEANAAQFELQLRAVKAGSKRALILDLSGLDIEDGIAIATALNALRELRARTRGLTLKGAPQMLGHNLYRIGLLEGSEAIELLDMRLDEPAGF